MITTSANRLPSSLSALLSTSFLAACGSGSADSASAESREFFALQTTIYLPDDSVSSYVALTDSLDVDGELPLDDAREFPGYAFIMAIDGRLLVSSGEEPTITQYELESAHDWNSVATLSFANQGVSSFGAGFERHWFLSENVAYLTLEVTSRIVWSPTDFEIITVVDDTNLDSRRDGLVLDATFNRPPQLLKGPVLKPFYYRDDDWFRFGPTTSIAVYDPETHEERNIVDVPCPALEVASQDEEGNTYFSPWTYGPALGLFGEGPELCIRRLKSDSTLDEDWKPDLTEWTDGRPVMVFRYLREGKALGTVLHVDEIEGDFSSGYNEDLAIELDNHYRLWLFDLNAETAKPVEGIGVTGSGFSMANIDGRAFVFVPNGDWSETTIHEVDQAGQAHLRLTVQGIVNNWIPIR